MYLGLQSSDIDRKYVFIIIQFWNIYRVYLILIITYTNYHLVPFQKPEIFFFFLIIKCQTPNIALDKTVICCWLWSKPSYFFFNMEFVRGEKLKMLAIPFWNFLKEMLLNTFTFHTYYKILFRPISEKV